MLWWWFIGINVALKIDPPYDPIMNIFLFNLVWFIERPETGIIFPSFLRSIKNPFIGCWRSILAFIEGAYSANAKLEISHSKILPSVPNDNKLY